MTGIVSVLAAMAPPPADATFRGHNGAITFSCLHKNRNVQVRVGTHPTEHNARVAEYLLQQCLAAGEHNARVAEYLLQQCLAAGEHNARVDESFGE